MVQELIINRFLLHACLTGNLNLIQEMTLTDVNTEQALIYASQNGHLEIIKHLVENGSDIHVQEDKAVRMASSNGHLEVVKYLIEKGADIHARNNDALKWAAIKNHFKIVKYLIEQGADIHADNDITLKKAVFYDHKDIIRYLIDNGANINADNFLEQAIKYNRLETVLYLLRKHAIMHYSMKVHKRIQEILIQNNPVNILKIKNLRQNLKKKYKHLLQAEKFGLFSNE